jgi:hypothetical protein
MKLAVESGLWWNTKQLIRADNNLLQESRVIKRRVCRAFMTFHY